MTGGTATEAENTNVYDEDVSDTDHPASTARPFTEEEKAWAAALHYSGQYWTKNALKNPPASFRDQARALALQPQANGLLFGDTRAGRLMTLIDLMQPDQRLAYQRLAAQRLEEGQRTAAAQGATPASLEPEPLLPIEAAGVPPGQSLHWRLPPLDAIFPLDQRLLKAAAQAQARQGDEAQVLAKNVQGVLRSFNVLADVLPDDISFGPTIVRIAIRPTGKQQMRKEEKSGQMVPVRDTAGNIVYEVRTKVSRIMALQNDLALALEAETIRVEAPVPGRPYVGVEIPNKNSRLVTLREILESREYQAAKAKSKLTVALGRDVEGQVRVGDLARMPHLLIAGATGAGKSVAINVIIASLLTQATPDDVRLLMVDPKMVELSMYNGIPHLLSPVVTEVEKVVPLLKNAINEMERRYRLFSQLGVRNLDGYRKMRLERIAKGDTSLDNIPAIVIIIDELADLMMAAPEEVEGMICRLAQLARAIGIHLVIATQRPSVDVITGLIKANFPTRISFMVSSGVDSRTIIDMVGAERLQGRGDMLYLPSDVGHPDRIQCAYLADEEAQGLVEYWRDTLVHQAHGRVALSFDPSSVTQLALPTWSLELEQGEEQAADKSQRGPAGSAKEPPKVQGLSEAELFEHLSEYLLFDKVCLDGTPLPVPLRELSFEDALLVAEVVAWKFQGSAIQINGKLRTKRGAELRDTLITRGLLNRDTQRPIHASKRLAPLLRECGILEEAESHPHPVKNHEEEETPGRDENQEAEELSPSS